MRHTTFLMLALCGTLHCSSLTFAQVRFVDVAASVGLGNLDSVPADGHAPGAIFNDLSGDGFADIYVMGGRNWSAGQMLPNRLFLNTPSPSGGRTFTELAGAAGAGDQGEHIGALSADYDNDGDQDLYVLNWDDTNRLYRNNLVESGGTLSFTDVTATTDPTPGADDDQHGVGRASMSGQAFDQSLTAAWADPDRDGDLDLYVGTHHGWAGWGGSTPGQRDTFYRNNGDGTFTDQTMPLGIPGFETASGQYSVPGFMNDSSSNAVIFSDFDNDQWIDLLVTNKVGGPYDRDMLYHNQGNDAQGNWLGYQTITYAMPTTFGNRSGAAMGVVVGDVENDGDLDIYITDWTPTDGDGNTLPGQGRNDLWINQFAQTGQIDFVHSGELDSLYSWGAQFEDFDNNGYQDLHVATNVAVPDSLYLNSASGFTEDVAAAAGLTETASGRGDVAADYDRDGLVDLLVINPWGAGQSRLYENRSDELSQSAVNNFLVVKLTGNPDLPGEFRSTRDAIGARVYVSADLDGDGQLESRERLVREVVSGSSNAASTSSLELEFGIGLASDAQIEILWPSGRTTRLTDVSANAHLQVTELPGDYNSDGRIDAIDYNFWRATLGQSPAIAGTRSDGNGDGLVNAFDYDVWRAQFGQSATQILSFGAARAPANTHSVPEPAAILWCAWILACLASGRIKK